MPVEFLVADKWLYSVLSADATLISLMPVDTVTVTVLSGTYTLTFNGQTTAGIAYNATKVAVQTALGALSSVGASNVLIDGDAGGPFDVWFQGTLLNTALPLTASGATITRTARVYDESAPDLAPYPFIVFSSVSPGNDLMGVSTNRIWAAPAYLVKAVVESRSYRGKARTIANRIDALLHGKALYGVGSVSGDNVVECVRNQPHKRSFRDPSSDRDFRELGGTYRIRAQGGG